jgi:hypothetical protein
LTLCDNSNEGLFCGAQEPIQAAEKAHLPKEEGILSDDSDFERYCAFNAAGGTAS